MNATSPPPFKYILHFDLKRSCNIPLKHIEHFNCNVQYYLQRKVCVFVVFWSEHFNFPLGKTEKLLCSYQRIEFHRFYHPQTVKNPTHKHILTDFLSNETWRKGSLWSQSFSFAIYCSCPSLTCCLIRCFFHINTCCVLGGSLSKRISRSSLSRPCLCILQTILKNNSTALGIW